MTFSDPFPGVRRMEEEATSTKRTTKGNWGTCRKKLHALWTPHAWGRKRRRTKAREKENRNNCKNMNPRWIRGDVWIWMAMRVMRCIRRLEHPLELFVGSETFIGWKCYEELCSTMFKTWSLNEFLKKISKISTGSSCTWPTWMKMMQKIARKWQPHYRRKLSHELR